MFFFVASRYIQRTIFFILFIFFFRFSDIIVIISCQLLSYFPFFCTSSLSSLLSYSFLFLFPSHFLPFLFSFLPSFLIFFLMGIRSGGADVLWIHTGQFSLFLRFSASLLLRPPSAPRPWLRPMGPGFSLQGMDSASGLRLPPPGPQGGWTDGQTDGQNIPCIL